MRRIVPRFAGFVALVAALLVVGGAPALAETLEDYLHEAAEADYAGRQVVVTVWDGESTAGVFVIEHAGDTLMIERGEHEAVVGGGKVSAASRDDRVVIARWTAMGYGTRYTTADPVEVRRIGRTAEAVAIYEGELLRARIVFDVETGAPLATEVFGSDGRTFRFSSLIEFDPLPRRLYSSTGLDGGEYDVMVPVDPGDLPVEVAGYRLADSYTGPDEVVHSFYSDGLFSFSLFEMEGSVGDDLFTEARAMEVDGAKYRVLVRPAQVWVHWSTPATSYVLVGDLPPDHLDQVLAELPKPRQRNILARLWNGLFG